MEQSIKARSNLSRESGRVAIPEKGQAAFESDLAGVGVLGGKLLLVYRITLDHLVFQVLPVCVVISIKGLDAFRVLGKPLRGMLLANYIRLSQFL